MFSMAGAFTPDPDSLEAVVIENKVDFIIDDQANLVQETFDLWLPNFASNIVRNQMDAIGDMPIYFDCGDVDELGVFAMNTAFKDTLDALGLTQRARVTSDGQYFWEEYEGGHSDGLANRIPVSFGFIGSVFFDALGVEDSEQTVLIPATAALQANWPNPFNAGTNIVFDLSQPSKVSLSVFDITGRKVATLVNGSQEAGRQMISWTPDASVSSGVYLLKLQTENTSDMRRIHLVK